MYPIIMLRIILVFDELNSTLGYTDDTDKTDKHGLKKYLKISFIYENAHRQRQNR